MKSFKRGQKGFTLVELAIALVIIGIIMGVVLKGQDLLQNARSKKFISKTKAWEVAQWTYTDRKGVFAGDTDADGKIGDGNVNTALVAANFIYPPYEGAAGAETNTIAMGSLTFYVFFGTDGGADAGKNIMVICKDAACSTFTSDEILYAEALDTSLDGSSNGAAGQVIGVNAAPGTITALEWEAVYAAAPAAAAWTALTTSAIVYYFDSKR
ncbi:MAG: prepilin-type N-terminal cleavage/methylation domain-containing protein [Nitrospirota bacterium]